MYKTVKWYDNVIDVVDCDVANTTSMLTIINDKCKLRDNHLNNYNTSHSGARHVSPITDTISHNLVTTIQSSSGKEF